MAYTQSAIKYTHAVSTTPQFRIYCSDIDASRRGIGDVVEDWWVWNIIQKVEVNKGDRDALMIQFVLPKPFSNSNCKRDTITLRERYEELELIRPIELRSIKISYVTSITEGENSLKISKFKFPLCELELFLCECFRRQRMGSHSLTIYALRIAMRWSLLLRILRNLPTKPRHLNTSL